MVERDWEGLAMVSLGAVYAMVVGGWCTMIRVWSCVLRLDICTGVEGGKQRHPTYSC